MSDAQPYKDRNGVVWTVVDSGASVFAYADPGSAIKYNPMPPDIDPAHAKGGDAPGAREHQQVRAAIDAYAAIHADRVVLEVKAGSGAWLVLLLAGALWWSEGKGRARRARR